MKANNKDTRDEGNQWVIPYREWQKSGVSQREYCKRAGLEFRQFKAGLEHARQKGVLERQNNKQNQPTTTNSRYQNTGFAPVKINTEGKDPEIPYCEIRFRREVGIQIATIESLQEFFNVINSGAQR
jgi:hypothetical protein